MNLTHLLTRLYDLGDSLMWAAALLSVPFWLYVMIYVAPSARTIAQQQKQDAVWLEDRAFCEKYGMPAGTREHTRCTQDLMKIRAEADRRSASEMAGLF